MSRLSGTHTSPVLPLTSRYLHRDTDLAHKYLNMGSHICRCILFVCRGRVYVCMQMSTHYACMQLMYVCKCRRITFVCNPLRRGCARVCAGESMREPFTFWKTYLCVHTLSNHKDSNTENRRLVHQISLVEHMYMYKIHFYMYTHTLVKHKCAYIFTSKKLEKNIM